MNSNERTRIPRGVRIGSVPYLNAVPLTRGLENKLVFLPPSQLGHAIRNGELDAALLSITEALYDPNYRILDGLGVCSRGPVYSVFLAHSVPLDSIKEVYCDPASLTSVNLLRTLLQRRGVQPAWRTLESYEEARRRDNVLLIGNPGIEFRQNNRRHEIWDLGEAWAEEMHLPFVYAVWVIRKDIMDTRLFKTLSQAYRKGQADLDDIVTSSNDFDLPFRRRYLTENIHYEIGDAERRGIARFVHELRQLSSRPVYDPEFISPAT